MLTRWEPFVGGNLNRLHNEMNRLFDRFGMGDSNSPALAYSYPPVNIWEDNEHVYAEAELPGMGQDDLEIYVSDGNQQIVLSHSRQLGFRVDVHGTGRFGDLRQRREPTHHSWRAQSPRATERRLASAGARPGKIRPRAYAAGEHQCR